MRDWKIVIVDRDRYFVVWRNYGTVVVIDIRM